MMDSISSVAPRRANAATKGGNVAATGSTFDAAPGWVSRSLARRRIRPHAPRVHGDVVRLDVGRLTRLAHAREHVLAVLGGARRPQRGGERGVRLDGGPVAASSRVSRVPHRVGVPAVAAAAPERLLAQRRELLRTTCSRVPAPTSPSHFLHPNAADRGRAGHVDRDSDGRRPRTRCGRRAQRAGCPRAPAPRGVRGATKTATASRRCASSNAPTLLPRGANAAAAFDAFVRRAFVDGCRVRAHRAARPGRDHVHQGAGREAAQRGVAPSAAPRRYRRPLKTILQTGRLPKGLAKDVYGDVHKTSTTRTASHAAASSSSEPKTENQRPKRKGTPLAPARADASRRRAPCTARAARARSGAATAPTC